MRNLVRIAALAFATVALAGCGQTKTIVKHAPPLEPCATADAMSKCVAELQRAYDHLRGDYDEVKTSCKLVQGDTWTCLMLQVYTMPLEDTTNVCSSLSVRRVGVGLPLVVKAGSSYDCYSRWIS